MTVVVILRATALMVPIETIAKVFDLPVNVLKAACDAGVLQFQNRAGKYHVSSREVASWLEARHECDSGNRSPKR